MILHTVASLWMVTAPAQDAAAEEEMPFSGGILMGHPTPEGFHVSRVISTDPSAYLNQSISPGSLYRFP